MTRQGDLVVVVPGYMSQPLDYYYSNTSDQTLEYSAYTAADLQVINAQKSNKTIFFVVTDDISAANPEGDAVTWLDENTQVIGSYQGANTNIYLLRSG